MPTQALHRRPAPTATDRWFHYDQVGSVMATTNASGALSELRHPDAFGNRMASWQTGLWTNTYAERKGWGHNSKEFDADIGLVYMHQRWYNPELGLFGSKAPYEPWIEHQYSFTEGDPIKRTDATGRSWNDIIETVKSACPYITCSTQQLIGAILSCVTECQTRGLSFAGLYNCWDTRGFGLGYSYHFRCLCVF